MARPKPNPDEIRPQLIQNAVALIKAKGFEGLTMKNLAQVSNMSVGKLYHFFPSKDDLFLTLEIEYFEGLYTCISFDDAKCSNVSAREWFSTMLEAYYLYAVEHLELYKLVTSPPKVYSHYVGTKVEPLAKKELDAALRMIALFRHGFEAAIFDGAQGLLAKELDQRFLLFVNSMHGLVLMSQSSAWAYISHSSDSSILLESDRQSVIDQLALIVERLV